MRFDRARATALLVATVLTASGWMVAAPTASADTIGSCIKTSKTYEKFKQCYENPQKGSDQGNQAGDDQKPDDKKADDQGDKADDKPTGGDKNKEKDKSTDRGDKHKEEEPRAR